MDLKLTHRSMMDFSDSLPRPNSSNPWQTFTRRLFTKKPELSPAVSATPKSKKVLVLSLPFGFGFRSFLYNGNMIVGIDPRVEGAGGECGG